MSLKVYRGRTLARSQALQLLFQAEATDSPLERVLEGDFLISKGPLDPYALELCRGAYEHIDRIDCALRSVAKNWDLMRMPGADRNLLRIAVYEMRFLTDEEVSDAIVVEVLELTGGEHNALELGAGVAGVLDDAAALDVAGLVAHKRAALARLDMLELDDGVDLVLNAETEAVLEVGGRNGRHSDLSCYGQNAQASKLHTTEIIHLQTAPAASA